jgi:hypothetical protein
MPTSCGEPATTDSMRSTLPSTSVIPDVERRPGSRMQVMTCCQPVLLTFHGEMVDV